MSIIDDMVRANSLATNAKEWRIGADGWHALMADLDHRGVRSISVEAWPTTFLGIPITRALNRGAPCWTLVADAIREPEAELYDDCS